MPVPSSIASLSTTASANPPLGGTPALPEMDDHIRQAYAFIAALRDGKLDASAVSVFMLTVLNDADAAAARATLGAAGLGANTFTGAQTLPGNATNPLHAMPLQQATGRLIGVRVFTTADSGSTYAPTTGATSVIVQAVGGGGAGGGLSATGVGEVSLSLGGGAGAYGVSRFTSGFSGATLTIGSGGTPAIGASGGNGGTTSFGALLSCPGGPGAGVGLAVSSAQNFSSVGSPYAAPPSGANISQSLGVGKPGVICLNGWGYLAGSGADSPLGSGGQGLGGSEAARAGSGYGSGGSGVANDASSAARAGGAGSPGAIIVWEYT